MAENAAGLPILTLLIFIPLIGAAALLFFPGERKDGIRSFALIVSLVNFFLSLWLLNGFDSSTHLMQFTERRQWIPGIGVDYFIGIDGISLLLILLTTLLSSVSILCSWTAVEDRVKEFMMHLLILETGMIGVFVSLDMVLFFLFWEIGLIPMYFLIGVWGGPRRLYANIKFFFYTLFGSVFMLAGIIGLYYAHGSATGEYTFNLLKLYEVSYSYNMQWWVFLAFFLGFAIKVPIFPFHTWLPDAHVEAPTAGSVILAGVLLKMGTYGFLRFSLPLLPDAARAYAPFVLTLSIIGVVYGAFLALAQKDIKKLVAYSSVSHLGIVMAGIFALNQQGIDGGVIQMINHGVSTGGLFLVIGMLYERRHTRDMGEFGGLSKVMPVFASFAVVIMLSSIAIPGTNGFIGELLIFIGLFKFSAFPAAVAVLGIVIGPVYMLGMCKKVILGKVTKPENAGLSDLNAREVITLAPIVVLIFWIGLYPGYFIRLTSASTANITRMFNKEITPLNPPFNKGGRITAHESIAENAVVDTQLPLSPPVSSGVAEAGAGDKR
ncbi:MAG: NADH-quinone oxidoreductase subunit M [Deltaproteobacteria bacterium]|nr:NADH-quinone oxidoreductase subunit M [Deltaproteobacteria bacterium]